MDFEQQDELRSKYALIRRGLSALRNSIEGLTMLKATGDPFFDDSEEACQKLIADSGKSRTPSHAERSRGTDSGIWP